MPRRESGTPMHVIAGIVTWGLMLTPLTMRAQAVDESRGAAAREAQLHVAEIAGGMTVDTGSMGFELRDAGELRSLRVGQKVLVANNQTPLLAAELFESRTYDGYRDAAPRRIIPASWKAEGRSGKGGSGKGGSGKGGSGKGVRNRLPTRSFGGFAQTVPDTFSGSA